MQTRCAWERRYAGGWVGVYIHCLGTTAPKIPQHKVPQILADERASGQDVPAPTLGNRAGFAGRSKKREARPTEVCDVFTWTTDDDDLPLKP